LDLFSKFLIERKKVLGDTFKSISKTNSSQLKSVIIIHKSEGK